MKQIFGLLILLLMCGLTTVNAQQNKPTPFVAAPSPALQSMVDAAAQAAIAKFSATGFKAENLSVTLIDLRDPNNLQQANFRGEEKVYPASVVKMFYLAAIHRWLADGKIKDSPELRRGLKDMIVSSSNDATQYIFDVLTGTSSGGELAPKKMAQWAFKRNAVNRYYAALGYRNINVNQKTFCEDSYGREHVFRGANGENRNKLTTNATARLLAEIALRRAVDAEHSEQMLALLTRDPYTPNSKDPDDQAHGFTGIALKDFPGVRLWSKAGWTSTTRHDAAYIEMPDGGRFVLVTFTTDFANERDIIPTVAAAIIKNMATPRPR